MEPTGEQTSATHDHVVRVWLDDRPGALAAVAARIGAVGGNVVGIEILEQGAGRVIDELVVQLPDPERVALLVSEVQEIEGVDVESVRPVAGAVHDRHVDMLDLAVDIVAAPTTPAALRALCDGVIDAFGATWAAVVDPATGVLGGCGDRPADAWVVAFVDGALESPAGVLGAGEVAVVVLEPGELVLVVDRTGEPFRERERRWLGSLGRVTGAALRPR